MDSEFEVIDAFVDGRLVEVPALKSALAKPAGRDYLVDAWLLREAIQAGDVTAAPSRHEPRSAGRPWLVAAAIAASLVGGFAIGQRTGSQPASPDVPQITAVVEKPPSSAFPVPAATRVIQLEFHSASSTSGGD